MYQHGPNETKNFSLDPTQTHTHTHTHTQFHQNPFIIFGYGTYDGDTVKTTLLCCSMQITTAMCT